MGWGQPKRLFIEARAEKPKTSAKRRGCKGTTDNVTLSGAFLIFLGQPVDFPVHLKRIDFP